MSFKEYLPWILIVGLVLYILSLKREVETIVIPPRSNTKVITTPIPVARIDSVPTSNGEFKLIRVPNPINQELLDRYSQTKDSLSKLQLYKEAITEREYEETLEDSVQTITVRSKVIGTLTEQTISYRTNPVTIERKALKSNTELYLGGFTTVSSDFTQSLNVGANISLINKNKIYSVGYDIQNNIHLGIALKLF